MRELVNPGGPASRPLLWNAEPQVLWGRTLKPNDSLFWGHLLSARASSAAGKISKSKTESSPAHPELMFYYREKKMCLPVSKQLREFPQVWSPTKQKRKRRYGVTSYVCVDVGVATLGGTIGEDSLKRWHHLSLECCGVSFGKIWDRGNNKCKGPGVGANLAYWKTSKKAIVAIAEWMRETCVKDRELARG